MTLRLAFMGSPGFALACLQALLAAGHEIACVYSQPPRPAGRGKRERATPVHEFAAARGLALRTPKSLKGAADIERFAALGCDAAIVAAFGLILPQPVLDAPRFGAINVHASLLPRWRGAAPIQRAIMAGDTSTGVQIMQMEAGLDTGPVLASTETDIGFDDTAGALHDRLAAMGAALLVATLARLERGEATATPQSQTGITYAHKLTPNETRIDWTRPAREIDCLIRGLSPQPGAWFELEGVRHKALLSRLGAGAGEPGAALDDNLLIACGAGAVRLLEVQREGRAPMPAGAFLRGHAVLAGKRLT